MKNEGESFLVDKGETLGAKVTSKIIGKPIFVSAGHLVSLEKAIRIVKNCSKTRIPEPLLQAHKLATEERIIREQKAT